MRISGERWYNSPPKHKSLVVKRFAMYGKCIFFVNVSASEIRMTIMRKQMDKKKVGFSVRKSSHLMPLAMCYVHGSHLCVAHYPTRLQRYRKFWTSPKLFGIILPKSKKCPTGWDTLSLNAIFREKDSYLNILYEREIQSQFIDLHSPKALLMLCLQKE